MVFWFWFQIRRWKKVLQELAFDISGLHMRAVIFWEGRHAVSFLEVSEEMKAVPVEGARLSRGWWWFGSLRPPTPPIKLFTYGIKVRVCMPYFRFACHIVCLCSLLFKDVTPCNPSYYDIYSGHTSREQAGVFVVNATHLKSKNGHVQCTLVS